MPRELLEQTRQINKLLQRSGGHPVDFNEMCRVLSKILKANVYLSSRKGRVLGYGLSDNFSCDVVEQDVLAKKMFPKEYNEKLLNYTETSANNYAQSPQCVFDHNTSCLFNDKITTFVPILGGADRLGTLIVARFGKEFTDADLVLAEYSATVVGMEILRSKTEELEEDARRKAVVQLAIGTLSYSELEAVEHIFEELEGNEGLLVASKIADRVGITRSVIVNALRKFESAGVIESRSLGMKGTYIKILNDKLLDELKRVR